MRQRSYRSNYYSMDDESDDARIDPLEQSIPVDVSHLGGAGGASLMPPSTTEDRLGLDGEGFTIESSHYRPNDGRGNRSYFSGGTFEDDLTSRGKMLEIAINAQPSLQSRIPSIPMSNHMGSSIPSIPDITKTVNERAKTGALVQVVGNTSFAGEIFHSNMTHNADALPHNEYEPDCFYRVKRRNVGSFTSRRPSSSQISNHQTYDYNNSSSEFAQLSRLTCNTENVGAHSTEENIVVKQSTLVTRVPSTLLKPPSLHLCPPKRVLDNLSPSPCPPLLRSLSPAYSSNSCESLAKDILDPRLIMRLNNASVASTGSIGLKDYEDYSRPVILVC